MYLGSTHLSALLKIGQHICKKKMHEIAITEKTATVINFKDEQIDSHMSNADRKHFSWVSL